jgi:hypothetical protein
MNKLLIAVLTLATVSCVPSTGYTPVHILGAAMLNESCEAQSNDLFVGRGELNVDLAAYANNTDADYLAQFQVESELQPIATVIDDEVISDASRNDFIVDTLVMNFATNPAGVAIAEQRTAFHFVLQAGARRTDSYVGADLIPRAVYQAVRGQLVALGDAVEVLVTFHLEGYLGTGERIRTNPVVFPVVLYKGGGIPLCADGTTAGSISPCGNTGQDTVYTCGGA